MAKTSMRIVLAIAALGTLGIILWGLFQPAQLALPATTVNMQGSPQVGLYRGNAAPNFTQTTLDGRKISLSDYRGKPVILNFWAIDCEACLIEMPGIEKEYTALHAAHKDLVVLGINTGDADGNVRQFVQRHALTYPMVLDNDATIQALYALSGTPTSYFIDRRGIIHAQSEGADDQATLQRYVDEISS
jgi:peroxiredoxin